MPPNPCPLVTRTFRRAWFLGWYTASHAPQATPRPYVPLPVRKRRPDYTVAWSRAWRAGYEDCIRYPRDHPHENP